MQLTWSNADLVVALKALQALLNQLESRTRAPFSP